MTIVGLLSWEGRTREAMATKHGAEELRQLQTTRPSSKLPKINKPMRMFYDESSMIEIVKLNCFVCIVVYADSINAGP